MMRIGIEFDGVCTDLSLIRELKISMLDYLYSPLSYSIVKPRTGILEILSILGLFADISLISSRTAEDETHINFWLSKYKLCSFFQNILFCANLDKNAIIEQHKITMLICDREIIMNSPTGNKKIIIWKNQSWIELAKEIFTYLTYISNAYIKIKPDLKLCEVEYLTVLGSSPVFILKFTDNTKFKLRVCMNYEVKNRLTKFLEITSKNNYKHVSRLITVNGLSIVKLYIEGNLISTFSETERLSYILKAGAALAVLHAIKIDESISNLTLGLNEDSDCLLVFSADNYNMIITTENDVSFIDLEACNTGSRWIDFVWSENLLCKNNRERKALAEGYFSIYKGKKATEKEMKMARHNYKLWLTLQLQNSLCIHSRDTQKRELICDTLLNVWNN